MDTFRNSLEATGTPKLWLVVSSILLIIAFTARKALHIEYDAREPPIIPQSIPYVGHLISIARYGSSYYAMINKKYNYPIYTLPTWTSRTYIITSPALAAIIQRASPKTSFYSAILEVTKRMVAFDTQAMQIVQNNANREAGDEGVMPESHDMLVSTLEPGPTLNRITTLQLEIFSSTLDKVRPQGKEVVELHSWLREQFSLANATAIYGPENLFSMNASLINDFWAFEAGIVSLIANILPRITARKAYFARERVMRGLVEYVELERYKEASSMIQKRVAINLKHGLSKKMVGHGELVMLFAILGNAVPTTFWFLAHLFSQPELLADVRSEIGDAVTIDELGTGEDGEKKIIHVEKLKSVAPILVSAYRETLRFVANLSSVRMILEDTVIAGKYLLKKDSIVQIASGVIHLDPDVWGPDAAEFNARRFLQTNTSEDVTEKTTTTPLPKNVPSAAFRAFGGGSVICPGRHFAQSEIVGFVAAVVMGFDFENPSGGVIELPERNDGLIPLVVMKPKRECMVVIKRRKGLEKVRWELKL